MSCRNKRRYYVVSVDEILFYARDKHGNLCMTFNLPWTKPYLFSQLTPAKKIAHEHRAFVRFWPGRITPNLETDNQ